MAHHQSLFLGGLDLAPGGGHSLIEIQWASATLLGDREILVDISEHTDIKVT